MADELVSFLRSPDSRLRTLESRMTAGFESLDLRLMSVESKSGSLHDTISALRDEMVSHVDGIYGRFDRLESEYHSLSAAGQRIEERHGSET